jgi:hypothetical protein
MYVPFSLFCIYKKKQDRGLIQMLGATRARAMGLNADLKGVPTTPDVAAALRGVPFEPYTISKGGFKKFIGVEKKAPELLDVREEELDEKVEEAAAAEEDEHSDEEDEEEEGDEEDEGFLTIGTQYNKGRHGVVRFRRAMGKKEKEKIKEKKNVLQCFRFILHIRYRSFKYLAWQESFNRSSLILCH